MSNMETLAKEENLTKEKSATTLSGEEHENLSDESSGLENIEQEIAEAHPEVERIIERLPEDERQVILTMMKQEIFSGPLPHPRHFKEYAAVYPDAPAKIFAIAEKQIEHRQNLENRRMSLEEITSKKTIRFYNTGMILGFILGFSFILGGYYCILQDKEAIGIGMIATAVGGLVAQFLFQGRKSKDSAAKQEE